MDNILLFIFPLTYNIFFSKSFEVQNVMFYCLKHNVKAKGVYCCIPFFKGAVRKTKGIEHFISNRLSKQTMQLPLDRTEKRFDVNSR